MKPGVRKFALSTHLTVSVGWIGAVLAYLALGMSATTSADLETVRSAWVAMDLLVRYVIIPLAVASLITGIVMALGTKWGLFRHYWVSISFFLTLFAVVILVSHVPDVGAMAAVAQDADRATLDALGGDLLHAGLGLVVLLVIQVLNLYKPQGLTRYGWRKQQERQRATQS